ncbi:MULTISPECIES: hypothetical protein [Pseudoalteromonas]|uniref:hypothetical protein n=1 Tax=Pseudoalteromonas TaxID=53246 RepID=UPI000F6491D9|nr:MULTISPECIES: hypothetical protein [Pseudoalteromonas]MDW7550898.1 hypothetical protein [Pseudoalteromonas peptidolytica]RRS09521.1 hypothetical protein EAG18_06120 [Pseudoalteromonas sp. J010]RXF05132.1 hypothetical protein D9603_04390 [Pseudoalteromonas sp. PS5]
MKRIICALLVSSAAITAHANETKTITASFSGSDVIELEIDVAVGKVDLETYHGDTIEVEILVAPKDSDSWFSTPDVNDAELTSKSHADKLSLEVPSDDYELSWHVKVPQSVALDIEVGVGKIEVNALNNSAELEVGVGKIKVAAMASDFKQVSLDSGVGKTSMSGYPASNTAKKSMVGSKTDYSGAGRYAIDAEVGVGNISLIKK